jgi:hypothetical protein
MTVLTSQEDKEQWLLEGKAMIARLHEYPSDALSTALNAHLRRCFNSSSPKEDEIRRWAERMCSAYRAYAEAPNSLREGRLQELLRITVQNPVFDPKFVQRENAKAELAHRNAASS